MLSACCKYGVVCTWCYVHIVNVVLCANGVVCMMCMWRCVHVVSCTCCACGAVYIKRFLVYEESSGKISPEKYTRLVSCGYEFILCLCYDK